MRVCAMAKIVELETELLYCLAYSPDLTPNDPFLFPNLKNWLNGRWFTSTADSIAQTNEYFAKLCNFFWRFKYFGKTCVQVGWAKRRLLWKINKTYFKKQRFLFFLRTYWTTLVIAYLFFFLMPSIAPGSIDCCIFFAKNHQAKAKGRYLFYIFFITYLTSSLLHGFTTP